MEMIPVQSSNVAAVGYDAEACALVVQFRSGGRYQYANVDSLLFDELRQASSVGRFVAHRLARRPEHPATRLPAGEAP